MRERRGKASFCFNGPFGFAPVLFFERVDGSLIRGRHSKRLRLLGLHEILKLRNALESGFAIVIELKGPTVLPFEMGFQFVLRVEELLAIGNDVLQPLFCFRELGLQEKDMLLPFPQKIGRARDIYKGSGFGYAIDGA